MLFISLEAMEILYSLSSFYLFYSFFCFLFLAHKEISKGWWHGFLYMPCRTLNVVKKREHEREKERERKRIAIHKQINTVLKDSKQCFMSTIIGFNINYSAKHNNVKNRFSIEWALIGFAKEKNVLRSRERYSVPHIYNGKQVTKAFAFTFMWLFCSFLFAIFLFFFK